MALTLAANLPAKDLYVSAGKGHDVNAGTSVEFPLKTLQRAESLVKPGDTVWIMAGTYRNSVTDTAAGGSSLLEITHSGTPDAWITWRNYKDDRPELIAQGCWNAINLKASYIVIDGLTLTGNNDNVRQIDAEANAELDVAATWAAWSAEGSADKSADYSATPSLKAGGGTPAAEKAKAPRKGKSRPRTFEAPSPLYNGNGVVADARAGKNYHHHILRNLVVRKFGTVGVTFMSTDYGIVENCEVYENGWYSRYGGSGISILGGREFDDGPGYHFIIRNNRVWNNKCLVRCFFVDLYTDGNGIIIDSLGDFPGGVLVENNLSYNNGGAGIHVFKSRKAPIDIVSNTVWRNQQLWQLYDLGAHAATNIRFLNNIVVADKYRQVNGKPGDGIVYDYNLYSGSPLIGARGEHDIDGDPLFVLPSTNRKAADFRVNPGSPALDSAGPALVPKTDLVGTKRPQGNAADRGAYEAVPPPMH